MDQTTGTGPASRIIVLATGGTISCTVDRTGALLPALSGEDIVRPVAGRFDPGVLGVEVEAHVHLHAADGREIIALRIEEQAVE